MKVVIVDDEMIERKAMRKLIEQHMNGIEVAGEAANGRLAIELAHALKPDVMLMDIKMPGISGLEAIRTIREAGLNIRFIMMTAYASFDYAREAMREGVSQYLVKPASREETVETLLRMQKEVNEQKKAARSLEQMIVSKVMHQEMNETIEGQLLKTAPDAKMAFFHVYGCQNEYAAGQLLQALNEWTPYGFLAGERYEGKLSVLFLAKDCQKADILLLAQKAARHAHTVVGAGLPYPLQEAGSSYPEAMLAFSQRQAGGGAAYGFAERRTASGRSSVKEAILKGEPFGDIKKYSLNELKEELAHVKKELSLAGVPVEDIDVIALDTTDLCQAAGRELADRVKMHKQSREMISKAKEFIHAHFHEPISLEDAADCVGLSPTYFTKLFKEKTNETFIGYLTHYRMEAARQLLQQTDISLKEVAVRTGYQDPNYFSKVFKKWSGYSPREYRHLF
ncbi:response regulator transcription factor [Domibacillus indicus]|uniref:response regulator transcription factor n=1 Tax=Domibacillus indicus TaxID=1437523 RepID=UPI0006181B61|nr:response regulator [Domibacillus indicus]